MKKICHRADGHISTRIHSFDNGFQPNDLKSVDNYIENCFGGIGIISMSIQNRHDVYKRQAEDFSLHDNPANSQKSMHSYIV